MTIQKRWLALALVVLIASAGSIQLTGQSKSGSSGEDKVITIDGSKNPEQIPQWLAWQEAFRAMGMPIQLELPIPTTVWQVTTAGERDLIRKEAVQVLERESEIEAQVVKIREALTPETRVRDQDRVKQLDLRRKQSILDARQRVLAGLRPEGQNTLRAFVEDLKKGIKVMVLESLLAEFSLPE